MSIWSSVTGVVEIHKSAKTSMEAVFERYFDEYNAGLHTEDCGDHFKHTFDITFSVEGENAFYLSQAFIRTLSQRKAKWVELETNIRWV